MITDGATPLAFLIRWVHVVSMAFLFGGAVLLWLLSMKSKIPRESGNESGKEGLVLAAAEKYEWLFWFVIGLIVMTGVGNLGVFGSGIPDRHTVWGWKLAIKLFAVMIFILLSLLRTLLITYLSAVGNRVISVPEQKIVRDIYAGTSLFSAALIFLALSLPHG